jgi:hypothetical protein
MNLITPFDFLRTFPEGLSIAIVGNAPSIHHSGLGEWIDSHDIVARFNTCALKEFEPHVGTRTDILVTHPYCEKRDRPPLDGIYRPRMVLVLNPQTRRAEQEAFERWVGDLPVLFSYTPDIKSDRPTRDIALTTGTYAISLLPALLRPKRVSVLGFTMFLPGTTGRYWKPNEAPPGLRAHTPSREAPILIDQINKISAEVEVGGDIEWVSKASDVRLRSGISVRNLAGWEQPPIS